MNGEVHLLVFRSNAESGSFIITNQEHFWIAMAAHLKKHPNDVPIAVLPATAQRVIRKVTCNKTMWDEIERAGYYSLKAA